MMGRLIRWVLPLAVLAAVGAGVAMAMSASTTSGGGTVKAAKVGKYGTVLVNSSGRTLYRYTLDKKGVNNCTKDATCAKYWPRLLVKGKPTAGAGVKAGLLGTIAQPKGMRQVTYAGYPLYTFAGDSKAGADKGQGFDKTWYVVNTKGALVKSAVSGGQGSTTTTAPSTTTSAWG